MNKTYDNSTTTSSSARDIQVINLRKANGSGSVRAYCDIRIETGLGSETIYGFSVVRQDGKDPWVSFPQKPGKTPRKWFPIYEADGTLKELIIAAVLDAFSQMPDKG